MLLRKELLRLAEQARSDIAHICLLQFVVFATHLIDADKLECAYDGLDVKTHGDKAIDELLIVTVITEQ